MKQTILIIILFLLFNVPGKEQNFIRYRFTHIYNSKQHTIRLTEFLDSYTKEDARIIIDSLKELNRTIKRSKKDKRFINENN